MIDGVERSSAPPTDGATPQPLFTRPDQDPRSQGYPLIGGTSASGATAKPPLNGSVPKTALITAAAAAALTGVVLIVVSLLPDRTSDETDDGATPLTDGSPTATWESTPDRPTTASVTVNPRPAAEVALDVSAPITQPACDGTGIVVLGSAVIPANYASEVQRLLDAHPGASYLRTDHACPSLRQVSDTGTAIYAVYRPAGRTERDICAAVHASGGDAYGKWLDTTTDPDFRLTC